MKEIKLIQTGKVEILAVKVPGNGDTAVNNGVLYYWEGKNLTQTPLPYGNWQPIGIQTELTEEQWREIVIHTIDGDPVNYWDYHNEAYTIYKTAKESGLSLMEANQCYSVNPFMKPGGGFDVSDEVYLSYHKSEANTGAWLILRRIYDN